MRTDALVRPDPVDVPESAAEVNSVDPRPSRPRPTGLGPRTLWFPIVALVAQQVLRLAGASHWFGNACHVAALGWVVVVSRRAARPLRTAGVLAASGGALNLVAIVSSGGLMPVSPSAVARLASDGKQDVIRDHVLVSEGLGRFIGDVIVVPPSLIVSPGDLLIVVALVVAGVHLRRRRNRLREGTPSWSQ